MTIIKLMDANTLHMAEPNSDSRPKIFKDTLVVLHRHEATTNQDESQPDQVAIQGDWRVIFAEDSGRTDPPDAFRDFRMVITQDKLTLKRVKPDMTSGANTVQLNHDGPLSEELARSLIPEAASISNEDFQTLQTKPSAESIENKSRAEFGQAQLDAGALSFGSLRTSLRKMQSASGSVWLGRHALPAIR